MAAAANRSFKRYVEQELGKVPSIVIYALLEWILIILLFIDGFLAFACNEFVRFFDMEMPCLLCTRIDHVLVRRTCDFYYNDSVCHVHKKELSSLAFCRVHKRLSDIRKMCEGCLLSFATEKDSDCFTYKSLVGILHKDLDCFVHHDDCSHIQLPAPKDSFNDTNVADSGERCSCCGEPLRLKASSRGSAPKSGKCPSPISHAPAPSPRAFVATRTGDQGPNVFLPPIRYTELKFVDADSEIGDENGVVPAAMKQGKEDLRSVSVPVIADADTEAIRTPAFAWENKFFGIPLTDSSRAAPKKLPLEKTEFAASDTASLMSLYMELEEERSASAVAANNAMAMITRLQAEKAAVQMEALQYQRMMDEQAEYDQEALQEMNDLLAKREEEVRAAEAELNAYRNKYGCLREEDFDIDAEEFEDFAPPPYSTEEEEEEEDEEVVVVVEEEEAPRSAERMSCLRKVAGFRQHNNTDNLISTEA